VPEAVEPRELHHPILTRSGYVPPDAAYLPIRAGAARLELNIDQREN
jgi:hypothetical protein